MMRILNKIGYIGHIVSTELLLRHLPETDARILDAGCGTGLVGEILKCKGFDDVVGIDFSPSMLDQAAEKGVYRSLELADLTQILHMMTMPLMRLFVPELLLVAILGRML
jgi:predicted TPR repeat methyltransferase